MAVMPPPPLKPSVLVATQRVEVPVVWRIMPLVPIAFVASRNPADTKRSVMVVVARVEVPNTANVPVAVTFTKPAVPVKRGELEKTLKPVPVSSDNKADSFVDVSREVLEILPLKVDQSVLVRRPRAVADEFGIFKVTVPPKVLEAAVKLKSVPVLVVANDNHGVARPALVSKPVIDGVYVRVLPAPVMVIPAVRPLNEPVEVAWVMVGPVCNCPVGPMPVIAEVRNPSDEVATQRVLVPVVWRTIPSVPAELVVSLNARAI